ncbi:hypothetical protein LN996_14075 [Arthrobacter sp. AK01]|uniref:hypothetical protein n=1 Tax=Micrococcaceae TaxID=1268 RepID=UPI001E5E098A|nr:hypothetical protein [Arthrobacter sp. AK01]MCP1412635.1 broad specificity phosphatase PhoE [Paenarthrobacter sp. A20]
MNEDGLTDAVQEAGAVELLLIRHGESEGNVAATEASLAGAETIQATTSVLNASITRYVRPTGAGPWELESFNVADHLAEQGVAVTEHAGDANVHPQ